MIHTLFRSFTISFFYRINYRFIILSSFILFYAQQAYSSTPLQNNSLDDIELYKMTLGTNIYLLCCKLEDYAKCATAMVYFNDAQEKYLELLNTEKTNLNYHDLKDPKTAVRMLTENNTHLPLLFRYIKEDVLLQAIDKAYTLQNQTVPLERFYLNIAAHANIFSDVLLNINNENIKNPQDLDYLKRITTFHIKTIDLAKSIRTVLQKKEKNISLVNEAITYKKDTLSLTKKHIKDKAYNLIDEEKAKLTLKRINIDAYDDSLHCFKNIVNNYLIDTAVGTFSSTAKKTIDEYAFTIDDLYKIADQHIQKLIKQETDKEWEITKPNPPKHHHHKKTKKHKKIKQSHKKHQNKNKAMETIEEDDEATETEEIVLEPEAPLYHIYPIQNPHLLYNGTNLLPITYTKTIHTWFNNPQSILKTDMRYNSPHAPHASLTAEKQADTTLHHQGIPLEMDREAILNGYQSIKKELNKDIIMVHTPVSINEKNGFMKYLLEKDGNNLKCFHRNFHPFALEACKGEDAIVIQLFFDMCQKEQSFYNNNFPSLENK